MVLKVRLLIRKRQVLSQGKEAKESLIVCSSDAPFSLFTMGERISYKPEVDHYKEKPIEKLLRI